jgi:uncharacterized membrane protein
LIPEESRGAAAIIRAAVEYSQHSGPLPSPESLSRYEQTLPGAAERILQMAERQAGHRLAMETLVLKSGVALQKWGLVCAFLIAISAI